jgi:hypothetical protein
MKVIGGVFAGIIGLIVAGVPGLLIAVGLCMLLSEDK